MAINSYLGTPMYSTPELSASPVTDKASLLEFNFKGKLKYYVPAVAIPILYGTIGNLITFIPNLSVKRF